MKTIVRGLGAVVGYSAATLNLGAYGWYGYLVLTGHVHTNLLTWLLWSIEAFASLFIYRDQTEDDRPLWAVEFTCAVGVLGIIGVIAYKVVMEGFSVVADFELWHIGSAIISAMIFKFWHGTRNSGGVWVSTIAFQFSIIFSVLPLIGSTRADPSGEPLMPWVIWSVVFGLQFLCALLRWKGAEKTLKTLPTPLNYWLWHTLMAGIIYMGAA